MLLLFDIIIIASFIYLFIY